MTSHPSTTEPVRTPLYDQHVKAGGKMVDFAGFMMPVQYPEGILKEHEQVRTRCGMFDLSHMGEFEVSGPGSAEAIRKLVCNDTLSLVDNQILYTPMCNDKGTIVDDLLVYRYSADRWMLVVNASNIAKDAAWVKKHLPKTVTFKDRSPECALVALQGPLAVEVVRQHCPAAAELKSFHFLEGQIRELPVLVSRTGYTGEDGFEMYCSADTAKRLWDLFIDDERVKPIGLGARDTLRFEGKLMLYGNDIDDTTTPLEAGIGWTVKLDGPDFVGKKVLVKQKEQGLPRKLVGLEMVGKGIARHGHDVLRDGKKVGRVTSGTYSPTLKKNLALAYVPKDLAEVGARVDVEIREKAVEAVVVKTPFYKRGK